MSGGSEIQAPAGPGDFLAPPGTPNIPDSEAKAPPPMYDPRRAPTLPSAHTGVPVGGFRTEQQRAKSVYRRANPWYRRIARVVVGTCFLIAGGAALYFGARELQDYLNRDRLPEAGVEIPSFGSTTFQITSSAPAPALDGTLEIDVATRAFRFDGRAAGDQAGVQVVSPDGVRILVQRGDTWVEAAEGDPVAVALSQAIPYVIGVDTADDILINRMRNGYVDLIDKTTEGVGSSARDRYEMQFDYAEYSTDQPLQWQAFQQEVIPGITELSDAQMTIWLDADGVLVRMRDPQTNWIWERLAYSDQGFDPDPTGQIAAAAGL